MYKESILTGVPQFIIASINFLITSSQATYLLKLEEEIERRIYKGKGIKKHKRNWRILLSAWWILTGTAIFTLFFRILPSMFVDNDIEKQCDYFFCLDFIIIFGTFIGYFLLATVAFFAWEWSKWRGKKEKIY